MTLRGGHLAGISLLVAIQLATSFAAIGLLTRMSPAVEKILAENVYSNEAAEQLVASLALALAGEGGDQRPAFDDAIQRARENITEPDEAPVIDRIDRAGHEFFDGNRASLPVAVENARQLIAINRAAMQRANEDAQRLGTAGAWAAVTLSLVGFLVSVVVVRRTIQRIVEPIEELEAALAAFQAGDPYRRCQGRVASEEMRHVLRGVNILLDRANRMETASKPD